MSRARVVVAGLGDTGLLTAIHLSSYAEVVGISAKPALVSGQELGLRLARPEAWSRDYCVDFDRFKKLDQVRTVHGVLTGVDLTGREVIVQEADGSATREPYDILVISTGASNGFWRRPDLQFAADVHAALQRNHHRLAQADSVMVIGGGAAAVSSAANIALVWPKKKVDLYFPGEHALTHHHRGVWAKVQRLLAERNVGLHPGHRAVIPEGFACEEITAAPVTWSTGQSAAQAQAVLWAIGTVQPNTGWLPAAILDDGGFVLVDSALRVRGQQGIFAIGDVAATDPLRTSARSRADKLLAHNIRAHLEGATLKTFTPARRRWGSVIGFQPNGLEIFAPSGQAFRFPAWTINTVLQPWIVRAGIYRGVRRPDPRSPTER